MVGFGVLQICLGRGVCYSVPNLASRDHIPKMLYEDVNKGTIEPTRIFKAGHCLKGSQCTLKVTIANFGTR